MIKLFSEKFDLRFIALSFLMTVVVIDEKELIFFQLNLKFPFKFFNDPFLNSLLTRFVTESNLYLGTLVKVPSCETYHHIRVETLTKY